MSIVPQTTIETRERLLAAAGEVFAEQGFHNATIREICDRAGANLAAVNYHFQSKEHLYTVVLRDAQGAAMAKYPPGANLPRDATPRQRLHGFVRAFLLRLLDQGRPAFHGKLMAREMIDPTSALDVLVENNIRPHAMILGLIVRDVLGRDDQALVRRCMASIVGQCLFYHHCRPVIERLFPQQGFEPADIEILADHITAFAYAALECLASEGDNSTRKGGDR